MGRAQVWRKRHRPRRDLHVLVPEGERRCVAKSGCREEGLVECGGLSKTDGVCVLLLQNCACKSLTSCFCVDGAETPVWGDPAAFAQVPRSCSRLIQTHNALAQCRTPDSVRSVRIVHASSAPHSASSERCAPCPSSEPHVADHALLRLSTLMTSFARASVRRPARGAENCGCWQAQKSPNSGKKGKCACSCGGKI